MPAADVKLFDAFDRELTFERRPPTDSISQIGSARDDWAGSTTGAITPENLVSIMRGDADLTRKMSLYKRMLLDPQMFAAMRILANTIARLKIVVLPRDDSAEAKKDAADAQTMYDGLRWLANLVKYLVFGEFYPFSSGELLWNRRNGVPDGFVRINPERWLWDRATNGPRLKTKKQPHRGEELPPWGFITHKAALAPGNVLDAGFGQVLTWPWMFSATSWEYQMRFAALFGNPHIWAFYEGSENEAVVFNAIKALMANARAAFPKGTEVKMAEAQRYGTIAVYKEIREASDGAKSKVILGNVLNLDAVSGTGTLAGNYAQAVSQENKEGVSVGVAESLQQGLLVPWWGFTRGWDRVLSNEIPITTIECKPPVDLANRATTFVSVNQALAPSGRAIDPEQIEDEFGVRTIEIKAVPAAADEEPADDKKDKKKQGRGGSGANHKPAKNDDDGDDDTDNEDVESKARVAAAAKKKKPQLANAAAIEDAQLAIVAAGAAEFTQRAAAILEGAASIEAGISLLWESYGTVDTTKVTAAMRDVTMCAHITSQADAAADLGGEA